MLSNALVEAINRQVRDEVYSAYLYLGMSAYCESINMPGFAHWMRTQFQEELGHALKLMEHLHDRGGRATLQSIEAPPAQWKNPLDVFQATLDHERKVTAKINELYSLATKENDYAAQSFLLWFVNEQVEEEKVASLIVEQLKVVGDRGGGILFLDKQLGKRTAEAE
jgi:ferritin